MDIKLICKKCGKEANEDDEKKNESNQNQKVYKTKCKCGGDFEFKPF